MQQQPDLSNFVLVLVDIQNDFLHPDGAFIRHGVSAPDPKDVEQLAANNRRLIDSARKLGRPVVHVHTVLRPDHIDSALSIVWRKRLPPDTGFLVEGTWGAQILDELEPTPDDFKVIKKGHGGFSHTHLDHLLFKLGVTSCVVSGGAVPGCVADTVEQGTALGYQVTVASDATYPARSPYLDEFEDLVHILPTDEILRLAEQGASSRTPVPERGAILVIDMLNAFATDDAGVPFDREDVLSNMQELASKARAKNWPLVFVNTALQPNLKDSAVGPFIDQWQSGQGITNLPTMGSWEAEIVSELQPAEADHIVVKKGYSGFAHTHLHRLLRNLGVKKCFIVGTGVDTSLEYTARDASDLGYEVTVIYDATYPPHSEPLDFLQTRAEQKSTAEALAIVEQPETLSR